MLMGLADSLGMETLWGEATASSASFYEKVLRIRPMKDLFIVHRDAMHEMSQTYFANQKHRLAMAGETKHIQQHESGRTKKAER